VNKGDLLVEQGAARLEELARKVASEGGFAARFAQPLAEDAVFQRKLKPSLVMARIRGDLPTNGTGQPENVPPPMPTSKPPKKSGSGPNPFLVAGAALVAGIVIAKLVDWRGHAHPRA
jgi:hypothetical protein